MSISFENTEFKPFDTKDCSCMSCLFCQIGLITNYKTNQTRRSSNHPSSTRKQQQQQQQHQPCKRKYFTPQDIGYSRSDVEYQLNMANYDAKQSNTKRVKGHLGPHGEYFYVYEWSTKAYDGVSTLNLIELCDLSQTPEYKAYRKNLQRFDGNYTKMRVKNLSSSIESELDSPIPVLIAFEKMASDHGRRLRIVNITDENLFNFFLLHRRYSIQSNDPTCLIDK